MAKKPQLHSIKGDKYPIFCYGHLRRQVTAWHVGVVARVLDVTAHNVVAVVTFWDLVVRIHTDLWRENLKLSTGEERRGGDTGEKSQEVQSGIYNQPWGCSFQASHLWYRSTGSRSRRYRCRSIPDSDPARWTPASRLSVTSFMTQMLIRRKALTDKVNRRWGDPWVITVEVGHVEQLLRRNAEMQYKLMYSSTVRCSPCTVLTCTAFCG